jgi:hypothetical protein
MSILEQACRDLDRAEEIGRRLDRQATPLTLDQRADAYAEPPRSAPEPLRRPTPAPSPYPTDELGPILGPACESIHRIVQAPDAVCGASLLAASSLAAQGLSDVWIDGRTYPLSLFMMTVSESGERKSAVDYEAMEAARAHERKLNQVYSEECAAHDSKQAEWESMRDTAKSDARKLKGKGLAAALDGLGPAPQSPLLPSLVVENFTIEGLTKMLASGQPAIGIFSDEGALVFGGHAMTRETVTRTVGSLSKLWDRGTLDRVRGGDGCVKLYGRRLAMHLLMQPVIAETALSDDVLAGQGFLARCLLAWPESTAGHRPYVAESLHDDPAMLKYVSTLAALHEQSFPLADGQRNELDLPALRLTPEAFKVWRGVHDAIESAIAPGGRFSTVRPWASKSPEQILRIAGVLTLVEDSNARNIGAPTVERAAEVALWHLGEAARLSGTAELSPEVRDAEALLSWCHATGRRQLHSRAALQFGPARIRERSRFVTAMGELERAGWASKIEGGADIDGAHRKNVWQIVPEGD